jgi:hypothetical protein
MPPENEPRLLEVIKKVAATQADVVIIGGVAIQMQGGRHVTFDIDFAYRRTLETARRIAAAMAEQNPIPVNWPDDVPFIWDELTLMNQTALTLETDLGRVDFLAEPAGVSTFEVLFRNAMVLEIDGMEVRVASIEDLLAMKRAAGRPKDLAHIAELETIQRLRAEESAG